MFIPRYKYPPGMYTNNLELFSGIPEFRAVYTVCLAYQFTGMNGIPLETLRLMQCFSHHRWFSNHGRLNGTRGTVNLLMCERVWIFTASHPPFPSPLHLDFILFLIQPPAPLPIHLFYIPYTFSLYPCAFNQKPKIANFVIVIIVIVQHLRKDNTRNFVIFGQDFCFFYFPLPIPPRPPPLCHRYTSGNFQCL